MPFLLEIGNFPFQVLSSRSSVCQLCDVCM